MWQTRRHYAARAENALARQLAAQTRMLVLTRSLNCPAAMATNASKLSRPWAELVQPNWTSLGGGGAGSPPATIPETSLNSPELNL